jgi:hypothetical protein
MGCGASTASPPNRASHDQATAPLDPASRYTASTDAADSAAPHIPASQESGSSLPIAAAASTEPPQDTQRAQYNKLREVGADMVNELIRLHELGSGERPTSRVRCVFHREYGLMAAKTWHDARGASDEANLLLRLRATHPHLFAEPIALLCDGDSRAEGQPNVLVMELLFVSKRELEEHSFSRAGAATLIQHALAEARLASQEHKWGLNDLHRGNVGFTVDRGTRRVVPKIFDVAPVDRENAESSIPSGEMFHDRSGTSSDDTPLIRCEPNKFEVTSTEEAPPDRWRDVQIGVHDDAQEILVANFCREVLNHESVSIRWNSTNCLRDWFWKFVGPSVNGENSPNNRHVMLHLARQLAESGWSTETFVWKIVPGCSGYDFVVRGGGDDTTFETWCDCLAVKPTAEFSLCRTLEVLNCDAISPRTPVRAYVSIDPARTNAWLTTAAPFHRGLHIRNLRFMRVDVAADVPLVVLWVHGCIVIEAEVPKGTVTAATLDSGIDRFLASLWWVWAGARETPESKPAHGVTVKVGRSLAVVLNATLQQYTTAVAVVALHELAHFMRRHVGLQHATAPRPRAPHADRKTRPSAICALEARSVNMIDARFDPCDPCLAPPLTDAGEMLEHAVFGARVPVGENRFQRWTHLLSQWDGATPFTMAPA